MTLPEGYGVVWDEDDPEYGDIQYEDANGDGVGEPNPGMEASKARQARMEEQGLWSTNDRFHEARWESMQRRPELAQTAKDMAQRKAYQLELDRYLAQSRQQRAMGQELRIVGGGMYRDAIAGKAPSAANVQQALAVDDAIRRGSGAGAEGGRSAMMAAGQTADAHRNAVYQGAQARSAEQLRAEQEYGHMMAGAHGVSAQNAKMGLGLAGAQADLESQQRALNQQMQHAYERGEFAYAKTVYDMMLQNKLRHEALEREIAEAEAARKAGQPTDLEYFAGMTEVVGGAAAAPATGGASLTVSKDGMRRLSR